MSKLLKNFTGVKDFLKEGHTADAFHPFLSTVQVSCKLSILRGSDRIRDAGAIVDRLRRFFRGVMVHGCDHAISSSNAALRDIKSKRCGIEH